MADPRPAIAVFGMAGVEPEIQREGLIGGLRADEVDAAIDDQFGLMTQRPVGLFFVVRIASDRFEFVKVVLRTKAFGHLGVPLAKISGSIPVLFEQVAVKRLDGVRACRVRVGGRPETAPGQPGQDRRATDPTNRMTDKRVLESGTACGQSVNIWRLDDRVSVTT